MRLVRTVDQKYVTLFELDDLFFDLEADPREFTTCDQHPELHGLRARCLDGFSWEATLARIDEDRQRMQPLMSGLKPSTPNQYRLPDGRVFDAEAELYGARWLQSDTFGMSGIIPQRFG
jgi:hypothetical protein